jgi:outer membrane murein-binding lipoprotein Lpp
MKRPWVVLLAVVLGVGLVAGCATVNAIDSARTSLDKAKAAGAESKAPFEYYAAEAYLGKAVHQAEKGDNRQADIFTKQSQDYSAKALGMAGGGAK